MDVDELVRDYLGRLEAAATGLPPDRRAELVGDVRMHIELALAESGATDEAAMRTVLERLGSPEEIGAADAAFDAPAPYASGAVTTAESVGSKAVPVETIALVLLTAGALILPIVGPLLGLAFVYASARWTTAEKRTASMIILVLLALPLVVLVPMAASGEITAMFSTFGPLVVLVPLSGIIAASYLLAALYLEVTFVLRRRSTS